VEQHSTEVNVDAVALSRACMLPEIVAKQRELAAAGLW
jgi:hypothetical protein